MGQGSQLCKSCLYCPFSFYLEDSMKKILLALAAITAIFTFASCSKKVEKGEFTSEKGKLKIGMEIGYPPFEYFDTDGKTPIGFDVRLGQELAKKLGLEAEFIDTAWDGILAGLDTDRYDIIISAMTITPDRLANYDFSKAYIGNAQSIILQKDSTLEISSPADLEGKKVGVQAETTSDYFMKKLHSEQELNYESAGYDKVMNAYDDLKLNRIDAVCSDSLVAVSYLSKPQSEYKKAWEGEAEEYFGICIKKGNSQLKNKINENLDKMIEDGTLTTIYTEIFGGDLLYTIENSPYNK